MSGKTINATYDSTSFARVADDGGANAGTLSTTNLDTTENVDTVFRTRSVIQQTTGTANAQLTQAFNLYYSYNGGTFTPVPAQAATSDPIRFANDSQSITDGTATTQRLSGSGTFIAGEWRESDPTSSITFSSGALSFTELEACVEIYGSYGGLANDDTIELRWYKGTTALDANTNTHLVTVAGLSATDALTGTNVESASEVTSPDIGQTHVLTGTNVESASAVFKTNQAEGVNPDLGQEHALTGTEVESASEVSTPDIAIVSILTGTDVESASEVTSPDIAQVHVFDGGSVESASEVTAPDIGQTHVLTGTDVESASEVTAPTLAEADTTDELTGTDVESASEVTSPDLGQTHVLTGTNVESASEVESSTIGQIHVLTGTSVESASEVTAPTLAEEGTHALTGTDVESASEVTAPTLFISGEVPEGDGSGARGLWSNTFTGTFN